MKSIIRRVRNRWTSLGRRGVRFLAESTGSRSLCMRARDGLDSVLEKIVPEHGVYVEAGAIDGFSFSNTYYLDRVKGWKGLLVEPNPLQCEACRKFRRRAIVVHGALVPMDYPDSVVSIRYGNDLSWTEGAYSGDELREREQLLARYGLSGESIEVPAYTLQSLLDKHQLQVTLFSLDVEGFEAQVLRGLDLSRSAPAFILVECQTEGRYKEVHDLLCEWYGEGEKLTRHDYLFRRR